MPKYRRYLYCNIRHACKSTRIVKRYGNCFGVRPREMRLLLPAELATFSILRRKLQENFVDDGIDGISLGGSGPGYSLNKRRRWELPGLLADVINQEDEDGEINFPITSVVSQTSPSPHRIRRDVLSVSSTFFPKANQVFSTPPTRKTAFPNRTNGMSTCQGLFAKGMTSAGGAEKGLSFSPRQGSKKLRGAQRLRPYLKKAKAAVATAAYRPQTDISVSEHDGIYYEFALPYKPNGFYFAQQFHGHSRMYYGTRSLSKSKGARQKHRKDGFAYKFISQDPFFYDDIGAQGQQTGFTQDVDVAPVGHIFDFADFGSYVRSPKQVRKRPSKRPTKDTTEAVPDQSVKDHAELDDGDDYDLLEEVDESGPPKTAVGDPERLTADMKEVHLDTSWSDSVQLLERGAFGSSKLRGTCEARVLLGLAQISKTAVGVIMSPASGSVGTECCIKGDQTVMGTLPGNRVTSELMQHFSGLWSISRIYCGTVSKVNSLPSFLQPLLSGRYRRLILQDLLNNRSGGSSTELQRTHSILQMDYELVCELCCETSDIVENNCGHMLCRFCWANHFEMQPNNPRNSSQCFRGHCNATVDLPLIAWATDGNTFASLVNAEIEHEMEKKGAAFCPSPECAAVLIPERPDVTTVLHLLVCDGCGKNWCSLCRTAYHGFCPCSQAAEYRKDVNAHLTIPELRTAEKGATIKRCRFRPNSAAYIQILDGYRKVCYTDARRICAVCKEDWKTHFVSAKKVWKKVKANAASDDHLDLADTDWRITAFRMALAAKTQRDHLFQLSISDVDQRGMVYFLLVVLEFAWAQCNQTSTGKKAAKEIVAQCRKVQFFVNCQGLKWDADPTWCKKQAKKLFSQMRAVCQKSIDL